MININNKLKILILDMEENKDIFLVIKKLKKYFVDGINKDDIVKNNMYIRIKRYDVLIVGSLNNVGIKEAFDIIDLFLESGKEILCIRQSGSNKTYLSNYLISNGCAYI